MYNYAIGCVGFVLICAGAYFLLRRWLFAEPFKLGAVEPFDEKRFHQWITGFVEEFGPHNVYISFPLHWRGRGACEGVEHSFSTLNTIKIEVKDSAKQVQIRKEMRAPF